VKRDATGMLCTEELQDLDDSSEGSLIDMVRVQSRGAWIKEEYQAELLHHSGERLLSERMVEVQVV
jgi:hypothetical protein